MLANTVSSLGLWLLSRWFLYVVSAVIVLLALASYLTEQHLTDLLMWVEHLFGWGYTVIYGGLLGTALFAWNILDDSSNRAYWSEVGLQAASGIATMSLTFTLLGISLGIGSLADKTIDPQTIQDIIQEVTRHFSTAFMTTVVGLPTANLLRAMIEIKLVK